MLILSRKIGERIVIGGEVELQVLAVEGGRVSLGLVAPREVRILRGELADNSTEVSPPNTASGPQRLLTSAIELEVELESPTSSSPPGPRDPVACRA